MFNGELRYWTMIVFSFSAAEEREIVSDAREKSSYTFESRHKAQIDYENGYEGNFRTPRQKHHLQHVYGGDWACSSKCR